MNTGTTRLLGIQEMPSNAAEICMERFRVQPRKEQLQAAGFIGRGKDVVLIAGCGWGKSLVYCLPLVFWDQGVIVIISPLRAIMTEQHRRLERLEISSICLVGGDKSVTDATIAKLVNGDYRAVFMTPEIMFENRLVEGLWCNQIWHSQLRAIVLDEAHCVFTWGDTFRKHYSQLGSLRPRLPSHVAFVALSATLSNEVLQVVKMSSGLDPNVTVINTGNDRPNIKFMVVRMQLLRYTSLDFLLTDWKKTIVYFDKLRELQRAYDYLRSSPRWHDAHMASYCAILSEEYKDEAMERFRKGQVLVLLASEAAGMGCDVSDIVRVIQFGAPPSILTLVQRFGRAAWTPGMQGYGIVFCTLNQQIGYVNDPQLREFFTTTTCRRRVLDKVFGNRHELNKNCCDLCHPESSVVGNLHRDLRPFNNIRYIPKGMRLDQEQAAVVRKELQQWRQMKYNQDVGLHTFFQMKSDVVLSDNMIDRLVQKAPMLKREEDVRDALKNWSAWDSRYLQELADLIQGAIVRAQIEASRRAQRFDGHSHNATVLRRPSLPNTTPTKAGHSVFHNSFPMDFKK